MSRMLKKSFYLIFLIPCLFFSCSEKRAFENTYVIGFDPSFYPLNLEGKEIYVRGFFEELSNLIRKEVRLNLIMLPMNWDNLVEGLDFSDYSGILSSIPYTRKNQNNFEFSKLFLSTGPALVIQKQTGFKTFEDFKEGFIGCVQFSEEDLYLQTLTNVFPHYYPSSSAALLALSKNEIDGALISGIPAISYVDDLYQDQLKIAGRILSDQGLRLLTKKDQHKKLIALFDEGLEGVKRSGAYTQLLKKWKLGS